MGRGMERLGRQVINNYGLVIMPRFNRLSWFPAKFSAGIREDSHGHDCPDRPRNHRPGDEALRPSMGKTLHFFFPFPAPPAEPALRAPFPKPDISKARYLDRKSHSRKIEAQNHPRLKAGEPEKGREVILV